MPHPQASALIPWFAQFCGSTSLNSNDAIAFLNTPVVIRDIPAGQDINLQGNAATSACLVLDGLLCTYEVIATGARQIQGYHLSGDMPDLPALLIGLNAHNLCALRQSKVAFVTHPELLKLIAAHPLLGACIWRKAMVDASISRSWITSIRRRSARSRLAHLFCELFARFDALGMARDTTIPVWITQTEMADAQGMSSVHVNRSMQSLKSSGLIKMSGKLVTITDWEGLVEAGDFEPTYLHLKSRGSLRSSDLP